MKLSFIILNYKTKHHLRLCLTNIYKLKLPFEFEVIVVDNASHDSSAAMVRQKFPAVHLIISEVNLGHPAGNNKGLQVASGDFIALINPDIIFHSAKDVEKVLQYMEKHPRVALLGPKLRNPDGKVQNSCYRRYSFWSPLYRRTIIGKLPFANKDIARHLMLDFDHNQTIDVEWLLGACLFVRRNAIEQIGCMNEKFFLYFADYEWCDRAIARGWKVQYFCDTEKIFHYHKRESATQRFSIIQAISYVTRIHLKDWITYLTLKKI